MNIAGNTILITGGGTGIGRGLAEALQAEGNTIIIAGRRKEILEEVIADHPYIRAVVLDVDDPKAIQSCADHIIREYPALNVVVNNAGIMRAENVFEPEHLLDAEATVTTNLLGPIRVTTAFLPHLLKQPAATVVNISSGLAFLPFALTPTYCATKAAIHSYSEALRFQLHQTNVEVIELVPPGVQTELMGPPNDQAMPLNKFIAETMALLKSQPTAKEICVERVKFLRGAEANGTYGETFQLLNQQVWDATHS